MSVRTADPSEHAEILSILDAAALQTDSEQLRAAIERDAVFVATPDKRETVLGALVLSGREVVAVAVRPGRRGQGIGRRLVSRAKQSRERLVAVHEREVTPFWTAADFEPAGETDNGRLRAVWEPG